MHLLGTRSTGLIFVISAPAGTGKTTLALKLCEEFPEQIVRSVTTTTRQPRTGEQEGKDYHFVDDGTFDRLEKEGAFLESASVFGKQYGTSKKDVEEIIATGKHVLLVIDTQGAATVRERATPITIFIKPPSKEELASRLTKRNTDSDVETRLAWASKELEEASKFNYCVVNDDLDVAYQVLRSIIIAEEHKVQR